MEENSNFPEITAQTRQVRHHNCVNTTQKHPNSWPDVFTEPPNKQQLSCQCQPCSGWAASKPSALLSLAAAASAPGPLPAQRQRHSTQHPALPRNRTSCPGPWSAQSYRTIASPPQSALKNTSESRILAAEDLGRVCVQMCGFCIRPGPCMERICCVNRHAFCSEFQTDLRMSLFTIQY